MKNWMPDPLFAKSRIVYGLERRRARPATHKRHVCILLFLFQAIFGNLFSITKAELARVVYDSDFLYQEMTDEKALSLVKQFPGNRMTLAQVGFINTICRKENVSFIWAMARAQAEQGVVVNLDGWRYNIRIERIFSYGLSIVDRATGVSPYLGFSNQVTNAIHRMRELFDEWSPGAVAPVDNFGLIQCRNAATHSLHRYNCRWGAASNHGVYNLGNVLFVEILRDFQTRWLSVAESK